MALHLVTATRTETATYVVEVHASTAADAKREALAVLEYGGSSSLVDLETVYTATEVDSIAFDDDDLDGLSDADIDDGNY